jgi:hypothetical protein
MSLGDVLNAGEYRSPQPSKAVTSNHFRQGHSVPADDLSEFLWLRDETNAAMRTSCDRETVWKLYNTLQEIETCIQNLQRAESL